MDDDDACDAKRARFLAKSLYKCAAHHLAAIDPAWPSNTAKKPFPGTPWKFEIILDASSIVGRKRAFWVWQKEALRYGGDEIAGAAEWE